MEETLTHRQLQSLIHISNVLNTSFDIDTIIESIMSETISVVEAAEGGSFWLYDCHENVLVAKTALGVFYPKIFRQIRLKPGESMTGKAFLEKRSISYPNEHDIKNALSTLSLLNDELLFKSIPESFSFSSVISSPIFLKGECIGVFTLDSFQQSLNFKQEDMNLLESICHQTAVALERSSLYKEKEATVKKLSYSIEAHRNLANLVLQGEDLHSILQYIHNWIGESVFLFDELGELISSSYDERLSIEILHSIKEQAGLIGGVMEQSPFVSNIKIGGVDYQLVSFSLGSKPIFLGMLIILSSKQMGEVDLAALEHACTVVSLELVKEQAVFDTQQRLKGEFVAGLFSGQMDEALLNKAKSLDFNPNRCYIAVIINLGLLLNEQNNLKDGLFRKIIQLANRAFLEKHTQGMTVRHQNQIVVLLSYHSNASYTSIVSQIRVRAKWVQQEIILRNWEIEASIGIGRVKQGLLYAHKSLHEAEKCIKFIQCYNSESKILSYTDLGIQRFILQNPEEEIVEFVQEVLGELIDYENSRKGELLKTLYVYLEYNQNVKKTADAMHVHINTLNYRLNRIEEILRTDLTNSTQLLNIHLAINIYEYMKKTSLQPRRKMQAAGIEDTHSV